MNDTGSVTIEAALALSSLVMVGALMVSGLVTLADYIAAVDAAGAAARAHAIGTEYTPPRGTVDIAHDGELVRAVAKVPSPLGTMEAVNGASVVECSVDGLDVTIRARSGGQEAVAKAGPV